jgi:hypothetical protein
MKGHKKIDLRKHPKFDGIVHPGGECSVCDQRRADLRTITLQIEYIPAIPVALQVFPGDHLAMRLCQKCGVSELSKNNVRVIACKCNSILTNA